ncbi:MAG TPA: redoxin domain-containing protein [Steroidobacteraceae bacterium]|jgi:thiol-disulfide isomerase/thioredoxin|nr:redoxin domain-containing protein [Steroidobacteraceae bacterium]
MTPVTRALVALVLVAGAGPAGFLIYHLVFNSHPLPVRPAGVPESSAPASSEATSSPTSAPTSGSPSPQVPTQTTSAHGATPLSLPETIALPDSNGRMHHLSEYRGHPLVLNFWATWCEPCRREIPLLTSLHRQYGSGVQIVGVAVDFQKDVLGYALAKDITYPLLMGEKDGLAAINALGMQTVLPFTVFADSKGDILAVKVGELHADEAQLILGKTLEVDAGKLGLAQARSGVSAGLRSLAIARAQQPSGASAGSGGKS